MSEIDTRLANLFDDVAATITPASRFEAVVTGGVGVPGGPPRRGAGGRPLRRGAIAAAAALLVVGGAAAAFELTGEPEMVATDDVAEPTTPATTPATAPDTVPAALDGGAEQPDAEPSSRPGPEPAPDEEAEPVVEEVTRTARLGEGELSGDPIVQVVLGAAGPGEVVLVGSPYGSASAEADEQARWKAVLELHDVPPATLVPLTVTFADGSTTELAIVSAADDPRPEPKPEPAPSTTAAPEPKPDPKPEPEPKPEPKPEPQFVEFTAKLGPGSPEASPMKQVVYGTATAGSKVLVTSAYGHTTAVAGDGGGWEAHLYMYEVPGGTNVRITATATGFARGYEFWVTRPKPEPKPEPVSKPFTAEVAASYVEGDPVKVVLHGTGTPGTVTKARSEHGTAEAMVGDAGRWELALKLFEVPPGATVGIRVTNSGAEAVYEFSVTKPGEPEPTYEFTAKAALEQSDASPAVNEYWGTGTPGSTITISSPYGGGQVTVGERGTWEARIEFPEAPNGTWFEVVVASSKDGASKTFPFRRVGPG